MKTSEKIIEILTALVGFVLLYAAASKMLEVRVFLAQLLRQPFPTWMAYALLVALPVTELTACYLLAMPRHRGKGLFGAFALMSAFTVYVWLGMTGRLGDVPCTCGGLLGRLMDWPTHFIFNVAVTALALIGLLIHHWKGGNTRKVN